MQDDICELLEQQIETAVACGFDIVPAFCLESESGRYVARARKCHPLETFINGQYITTTINQEIAHAMGVSLHWIDGFVDGYADKKPSKLYYALEDHDIYKKRYIWGYFCGLKIRDRVAFIEAMTSLNPA